MVMAPSENTAEMYTATPNPTVDTPVKESVRKHLLAIAPYVTCILNPVENLQNPDIPYGNYAPVPLITLRPDNGYGLYDPMVMYIGSSSPAVFALRPDGGYQIIPPEPGNSPEEFMLFTSGGKTSGPFLAVFIRPAPAKVEVRKVSDLTINKETSGHIIVLVTEAPGVGSVEMTYNPYQQTVTPEQGGPVEMTKSNMPLPTTIDVKR